MLEREVGVRGQVKEACVSQLLLDLVSQGLFGISAI